MISRALVPLFTSLLLAACFDDSRGEGTDSTASATALTTGSASQVTGDDTSTSSTTTSSTSTGWTTEEPTTWVTSTGPATQTTGEPPDTTTTTTGEGNAGCEMYCSAMMAACGGVNAQYTSVESCIGACGGMPPGNPGETSGNSLSCRIYHAGMASIDPAVHCVHAGPSGAGACGQNCEGFCAIANSICPAEHPTVDQCLGNCQVFPDTEPYNTEDAAGDTLACRIYHLMIAATSPGDAEVHCGHTLAGSPVCM